MNNALHFTYIVSQNLSTSRLLERFVKIRALEGREGAVKSRAPALNGSIDTSSHTRFVGESAPVRTIKLFGKKDVRALPIQPVGLERLQKDGREAALIVQAARRQILTRHLQR